eukprot:1201054-Amphidinium_carterae.1
MFRHSMEEDNRCKACHRSPGTELRRLVQRDCWQQFMITFLGHNASCDQTVATGMSGSSRSDDYC